MPAAVGLVLALFVSGVVAGAAGDTFIIGQANDSGTSQSILLNAGLGAAFTLKTTNTATGATGIFGWSSNTGTNATRGVYGKADGPNSYGVFGRQSGAVGQGAAVYAEGNANDGLVVTTSNTNGRAVFGDATAASGVNFGVRGESASTSGRGVYGLATAGSGNSLGVYGVTLSPSGTGVFGFALAGSGDARGVWGQASSPDGAGGYFVNTTGTDLAVDLIVGGVGADANGIIASEPTETESDIILQVNDRLRIDLDKDNNSGGSEFLIQNGSGQLVFKVNESGGVYADGAYHCGGSISDAAGDLTEAEIAPCLIDDAPADFAEVLPAAHGLRPGDVLVVGPDGRLILSTKTFDCAVVGVYSTRLSYLGSARRYGEPGYVPLAVVGVVPVKVSAENGAIGPGDLLVTSATAGHAMRAGDSVVAGTIIGKALGTLEWGTGMITMLVLAG